MPRKPPKISDLRHRVRLCTNEDVVINGAEMVLRRKEVRASWAAIEHQTHMSSFISKEGFAVQENTARPTHRITVRAQHDLDFSAAAWVYEEFLKSPPRWYKVLGFVDEENWIMLECHLVERNANAAPTAPPDPCDPATPTLGPAKQDVVL